LGRSIKFRQKLLHQTSILKEDHYPFELNHLVRERERRGCGEGGGGGGVYH
jgi:hypothetical protein